MWTEYLPWIFHALFSLTDCHEAASSICPSHCPLSVCVCGPERKWESMRAIPFVYTESKVCLRALTEYTLVFLPLSSCASVCILYLWLQPEMFEKTRMFFQWRLQMNIQALSGFGNGKLCVSCCVCVYVCACGRGSDVSWHISQHTVYITMSVFWYFLICITAKDVIGSFVVEKRGERRWGFSDCTRWMDVSVIIWITVCFVSGPRPFYRECKARSNLTMSVFHLSLEQTGAGELTHIYHQCEIPAPLIWS